MFVWIGFIACIIVGLYLVAVALIVLFATSAFSGRVSKEDWLLCAFLLILGGAALYVSCVNAPFSISFE